MGTDFTYSAAPYWFDQLDALIRNVNALEGDKLNVFYSNPGAYLDAKRQGLTLVHFSAPPEPFLTLRTSPKRLNTPSTTAINPLPS